MDEERVPRYKTPQASGRAERLRVRLILICLALISGCAQRPSSAGAKVTVYRGASVELLASCRRLGTVRAHSVAVIPAQVRDAETRIQDRAAAPVANAVAIVDQTGPAMAPAGVNLTGVAYCCRNARL